MSSKFNRALLLFKDNIALKEIGLIPLVARKFYLKKIITISQIWVN